MDKLQNKGKVGRYSTRCPKKTMKRHITCPKVRFGKKVMFSGPYGSLEVI